LLTLRNYRWLGSRFPLGRPGGRDAHEVVAGSQRITVPAMLTINDAACSWRVTRNTPPAWRAPACGAGMTAQAGQAAAASIKVPAAGLTGALSW
jgi:hypothetical protein